MFIFIEGIELMGGKISSFVDFQNLNFWLSGKFYKIFEDFELGKRFTLTTHKLNPKFSCEIMSENDKYHESFKWSMCWWNTNIWMNENISLYCSNNIFLWHVYMLLLLWHTTLHKLFFVTKNFLSSPIKKMCKFLKLRCFTCINATTSQMKLQQTTCLHVNWQPPICITH